MARLISEINPKINLRDLVGLILVMMRPAHAHIVLIVNSTDLPVPFLIIRIYWVTPRLLTRDILSTDLHDDSFGELEYQVGSSAKILLQYL